MSQTVKIAPSILAADFAHLADDVTTAVQAGADQIHIDVMDGHFVPNITMGPVVARALRPVTDLPLDVHLMISDPDDYLAPFADAGVNLLTAHIEATPHIHRIVQRIHQLGLKAGVAINPASPVSMLSEIAAVVDLILVMSVNPGFGGQSFIGQSVDKVSQVRALLNECGNTDADISVDGGVSTENAARLVSAGATVLVAGSSIFRSDVGVAGAIANLKQAAKAAGSLS